MLVLPCFTHINPLYEPTNSRDFEWLNLPKPPEEGATLPGNRFSATNKTGNLSEIGI